MANQGSDCPLIPAFFNHWCVKMKTIFRSLDLWEYVEDGYDEPPSTTNLRNQELKAFKEHRRKNAKAISYIQQGLSPNIFLRIIGATQAKEVWEILQKEFQRNVKVKNATLQTLRREFQNLKMNEAENVQDYYTKIVKIVNEMKTFGEEIKDNQIIENILVSLSPKFDSMVSIIEDIKHISSMKIQELIGSLMTHEKSFESAFQSKLNITPKNDEGGESSRGGRYVRGRL
ncbi:uncharacterized protein LOC120257365 [Dioscorea cayenensis subsp. rotundata]|uniref:Uncharacterized protein LOC120257365 n=1 Tax=Dioscorea cayennensis subsp. rotundata TaxID=55577 RepID=A0AB40B121_DIOCR|nr:uncharacterized protein LOC120257365 [Dioscorea cayenensis subsp. rotundata]